MSLEIKGKVPEYVEGAFLRIDSGIKEAAKKHEQLDRKLLPELKPLFADILKQLQQHRHEEEGSLLLDRSLLKKTEDGIDVIGMTALSPQGIVIQVIASREGILQPLSQRVHKIEEFVENIDSVAVLAKLVGAVIYQIQPPTDTNATVYR